MNRPILSLMLAGVFALTVTHPAGSQSSQKDAARQKEDAYTVKIDNFSFNPATLTVPAGTTVTWINNDDIPHTVVSAEGDAIKSPVLDTDEKFTYTFAKAGTYSYYCSVHPKMTGRIVVR